MDLFVIEATGKIDHIEALLDEYGFEEDYEVVATRGKILELPHDELALSRGAMPGPWYIKHERLYHDLADKCKQANKVWIMTDADQEGELIAAQFLKEFEPKHWQRIHLKSLSLFGLERAFEESIDLNREKATVAFARRGLDRFIGYVLSNQLADNKGVQLGTVLTPTLQLLSNEEYIAGEFVHRIPAEETGVHYEARVPVKRKDMMEAKEIASAIRFQEFDPIAAEQTVELSDNRSLTIDCGDAILHASKTLNKPVNEVYQSMQQAYESGNLSYPRTDSYRLDENGIECAQNIAYRNGRSFDTGKLDSLFAIKNQTADHKVQDAHEAIHPITDEVPIHSDYQDLNDEDKILKCLTEEVIDRLTESPAQLIKINESAFEQLPSDIKRRIRRLFGKLRWIQKEGEIKEANVKFEAEKSDRIILALMHKNKIGRPSSFTHHTLKIIQRFWNEDTYSLNGRGVQSLVAARNGCPGLLKPESDSSIQFILESVIEQTGGNARLAIAEALKVLNISPEEVEERLAQFKADNPNMFPSDVVMKERARLHEERQAHRDSKKAKPAPQRHLASNKQRFKRDYHQTSKE